MKRTFYGIMLMALVAAPLLAHGKGKLRLGSQSLTPGSAVELFGTEFAKENIFTVYLVGAAGRFPMGEVESDANGKFTRTLTVPAAAAVGSYRVVLEAEDGDQVAMADVQVAAGPVLAEGEHQHPDGDAGHDEDAPTHEALDLDRARRPLVTGGALVGIVAALAMGVLLLRKNGSA